MSNFVQSPAAVPRRGPTLELLILALPMIGMTLSRLLMSIIDFVMVSQLGTASQAAISPSALMLFVIACLGMGMAQGVQTFVSQADGRKEPERAGVYVWQALYIALACGLLSAPITWAAPYWLAQIGKFGHHPPAVLAQEISFLSIALWSIAPMAATAALESFYNGIRRPGICLVGVIASLTTITVGNYVLIFGHFGFPALGIAGSGWATLAAWVARLIVLIVPLTWSEIDNRYHLLRAARLNIGKLLEVVRVGGPIALQWLVDIGAWLVFLELMMPPYGEATMAAAALAIQFMHFSFMPAIGIGLALTTQVGNAIGAGRPDEAMFRVRVARRLVVIYMAVMGAVFIFGGERLVSILSFEKQDQTLHADVLRIGAGMLIWVALFQISDALCIIYSFASRGAGDTKVPALLFFFCCWGIFVGGGYAAVMFAPQMGFHGPWMMCTAYIIVLSGLLWWRFHTEKWRKIRLFSGGASVPIPCETCDHDLTGNQGSVCPECGAPRAAELSAVQPVSG